MARQAGPIYIKGTIDDLTFYQMDGEHFVRMKSSLTRKKVLESPRFALTRMHASQLAEASRIASIIYRQIPKEEKSIKLFRSIVGKAKVLLKEGKQKEEVIESLSQWSEGKNEKCKMKNVKKPHFFQTGKESKGVKDINTPELQPLRFTRGKLIIKDLSNASHLPQE